MYVFLSDIFLIKNYKNILIKYCFFFKVIYTRNHSNILFNLFFYVELGYFMREKGKK